jgi:hypothetical protein
MAYVQHIVAVAMLLVSPYMFQLSSSQFLTKVCVCVLLCTLGHLKLAWNKHLDFKCSPWMTEAITITMSDRSSSCKYIWRIHNNISRLTCHSTLPLEYNLLKYSFSLSISMQWLRQRGAGLWPWRAKFYLTPVHVGFVVDKVVLGQIFLWVLWCNPVIVSPSVLCIHVSFSDRQRCVMAVDRLMK